MLEPILSPGVATGNQNACSQVSHIHVITWSLARVAQRISARSGGIRAPGTWHLPLLRLAQM